tara:strand:- start:1 stop:291 length:291 start_codon:yes stop_codon:yes gene_type:complete
MNWKNILKEITPPQFNNIEEMVLWMLNNNIKNGREISNKWHENVGQKTQYRDVETQGSVTDNAVIILEPLTKYITRDMGLREQWISLLQQKKIMGD